MAVSKWQKHFGSGSKILRAGVLPPASGSCCCDDDTFAWAACATSTAAGCDNTLELLGDHVPGDVVTVGGASFVLGSLTLSTWTLVGDEGGVRTWVYLMRDAPGSTSFACPVGGPQDPCPLNPDCGLGLVTVYTDTMTSSLHSLVSTSYLQFGDPDQCQVSTSVVLDNYGNLSDLTAGRNFGPSCRVRRRWIVDVTGAGSSIEGPISPNGDLGPPNFLTRSGGYGPLAELYEPFGCYVPGHCCHFDKPLCAGFECGQDAGALPSSPPTFPVGISYPGAVVGGNPPDTDDGIRALAGITVTRRLRIYQDLLLL